MRILKFKVLLRASFDFEDNSVCDEIRYQKASRSRLSFSLWSNPYGDFKRKQLYCFAQPRADGAEKSLRLYYMLRCTQRDKAAQFKN